MVSDILKKILIVVASLFVLAALVLILVYSLSSKGKDDEEGKEFKTEEMVIYATGSDATTEQVEVTTEIKKSGEDILSQNAGLLDEESKKSENKPDAASYSASAGNATYNYGTYDDSSLVDEQAPKFLVSASSAKVARGDTFDASKYVGYGDDVDREVELTVDGDVDTSTLGSYQVTLNLKDDAGHTTSSNMTVNVVETVSPDAVGPTAPSGDTFEQFQSKYKTEETSLGIDVSRWQNNIDFTKVKAAGCDYVIMRLGGYDDGSHYTDKMFKYNIEAAKQAGLKIGIYWHAEESSADEVKSSVNYLMDILGEEKLDFPIVYDWEDFADFEKYKMNLHDINNCFDVFCQEVEKNGYSACLYSSKNFLQNVWTNTYDHPVWLAHYTSQTDYNGKYFMWQQSSTGEIDGIETAVDFDILYVNQMH